MVLFCHLLIYYIYNQETKAYAEDPLKSKHCKYVPSIYVEIPCLSNVSSFPQSPGLEDLKSGEESLLRKASADFGPFHHVVMFL